jgi:hypothetical protein
MEITRCEFIEMTAGAAVVVSARAAPASDELAKLTIAEASRKIRLGEISCTQLT